MWLGDVRVGELRQDDEAFVEFVPDRRWQEDGDRPILGQWFEERPGRRQRGGRPNELPPFFANLIPEGDLGLILRERLGIAPHDDLGLLIATGADLPGALVINADGTHENLPPRATNPAEPDNTEARPRIKFSLAGVQLKFSMLRVGDRFMFPGRDTRGDWIAKIAHADFVGLCENEFLTMEWARKVGFDVPPCELRTLGELVDVPHEGDPKMPVFTIKRYDREGSARIHQEDMMQVLGFPNWPSSRKYNDATYEQLAFLLSRLVGPDAFEEMLRRIAFVVASGNNDAHLKNWSILYPDRVSAQLTPLYDQTFSGQWKALDRQLALKLGGTKHFSAIDMKRFREFAARCSRDPDEASSIVSGLVERIAETWTVLSGEFPVSDDYRHALRRHWASVPLLAPHANRI